MSAQDPGAQSYAYWNSPDGSVRVIYSLPLFHEIDMSVNEGYRMIPRGGIETAGLLFGAVGPSSIRIDQFRPIECQHAMGPSFTLSEQDLERLRNQLIDVRSDPELGGAQVVGWFIAHTRNPLRMNDAEVRWFEELISGSPRVTVLVKPEHFQPTRFGFLLRRNGMIERDATQSAIILPLPGKAPESDAPPTPSIPAPFERTTEPRPSSVVSAPASTATPRQSEPVTQSELVSRAVSEALPVPLEIPAGEPSSQIEPENAISESGPVESIPGNDNEAATKPVSIPRSFFLKEPAGIPEAPVPSPSPVAEVPVRHSLDDVPSVRPRPGIIPGSDFRPLPRTPEPSDNLGAKLQAQFQNPRYETLAEPGGRSSHFRFAAVLLLSAILGCIAGYWAYLQLPAPVIPLTVREQGRDLIVEWPAKQTESVDYAALRINDGPPFPLTSSQREAGTLRITPPPGNVKFELIAKHWFRDSRGIVRYIRTAASISWPELRRLFES